MNGNTQRGMARILSCSKNTVERKIFWLRKHPPQIELNPTWHIQIDEMESIEHTKLKPLTIPVCIDQNYQILALSVGTIKAKGHLSELSVKKYGLRQDQREKALSEVLEKVRLMNPRPLSITTDSHPLYPRLIKKYFPYTEHRQILSKEKVKKHKELVYTAERKKIFDPMFAINQRFAKMRADIRRLTRRSWCTTKKMENLKTQLELYQIYNNQLVMS